MAAEADKQHKPTKFFIILKVLFLALAVVLAAYATGAIARKVIDHRHQVEQVELDKINQQSNKLVGDHKYADAIKLWQDYLAKPPPKRLRYETHLQLATVYFNGAQYAQSINELKAAEREKPGDYAVMQGIAEASTQTGDKATAIEYFKKAIEFLKNSKRQTAPLDISVYQERIKQLGGTP